MSKITASIAIQQATDQDRPRVIELAFQDIVRALTNGLSFSDNLDVKFVNITFTATDADTSVQHGLGRVPSGYFVIGSTCKSAPYNGTAANTKSLLTLKCSNLGTANLIIF